MSLETIGEALDYKIWGSGVQIFPRCAKDFNGFADPLVPLNSPCGKLSGTIMGAVPELNAALFHSQHFLHRLTLPFGVCAKFDSLTCHGER